MIMKSGKANEVTMKEYLAAKMELENLRKEYNIPTPESEEGKISKLITRFFDWKENRPTVKRNRKTYLLLAIFTGFIGGHHFYAKHYVSGALYLITCWTGFSIAMTLIDLMIALPKEIDDKGEILV